jgi:hypothetical protein
MTRIYLILLFYFFSTVASAQPVEVIPPQNKTLGTSSGRYVFGQISSARKDQYMLDTQTGRLWQIVVDDKTVLKLQPITYIQGIGNETYIPK